MGLDIPDKTLQSYWDYTTDTLEPVAQAVLSGVFESLIVAADDSHLKTLTKGGKHGAFRGHIWCFVGTDGTVCGPETVAYGYTKSWDAAEMVTRDTPARSKMRAAKRVSLYRMIGVSAAECTFAPSFTRRY